MLLKGCPAISSDCGKGAATPWPTSTSPPASCCAARSRTACWTPGRRALPRITRYKRKMDDFTPWPPLPLAEWEATRATLHMWTQIVGKVRLALSPRVNHWWEVPLYVSSRGLTTSPIPYGTGIFEIEFDFLAHQLQIRTSWRSSSSLPLEPRSVAD